MDPVSDSGTDRVVESPETLPESVVNFNMEQNSEQSDKTMDTLESIIIQTESMIQSDNLLLKDKCVAVEHEEVDITLTEYAHNSPSVANQGEPMDISDIHEVNTNGDVTAHGISNEQLPTQETNDAETTDNVIEKIPEHSIDTTDLSSEITTHNIEIPPQSDTPLETSTSAMEPRKAIEDGATEPMETETGDQSAINAADHSDNSLHHDDSESGSEDDCASEHEKALEKMDEGSSKEEESVPEPEPIIEPLNEINLEIQTKELKLGCYVCKKIKIVKYSFMRKADTEEDKEVEDEYICGDACFNKLEPNCKKINQATYFDKKLHIPEDALVKYTRECKQCLRIINENKGYCSWEAKDFCREYCLNRFQHKFTKCSECSKKVEFHQLGKYSVRFGSIIRQFCSGACLDTRKKKIRLCSFCQLAMSSTTDPKIAIAQRFFCTYKCRDKFVQLTTPNKPPYIPKKETTFCFICSDNSKEITKEFSYQNTSYYFCGDECLTVFKFLHNLNGKVAKCHNCWIYATVNQLQKYSMHYDGAYNLFCSVICQNIYVISRRRIIICAWCKVKKYNFDLVSRYGWFGEVIYACSLNCLNQFKAALDNVVSTNRKCEHCGEEKVECEITGRNGATKTFCSNDCVAEHQAKLRKRESRNDAPEALVSPKSKPDNQPQRKIIIVQEELPPDVANKMCQVRLMKEDQETQISIEKAEKECEVDFEDELRLKVVLVPIYVPQPLCMWNVPLPRAVPFPLVVPLPLLIPLTRDPSTEYLKTMKKEPVKTPRDPFEAELLMMAELVAAEKPKEELMDEAEEAVDDFSPDTADTSFNETEVLQMAFKMATDYQEPAVDFEGALEPTTITPGVQEMELTSADDIIHTEPLTGAIRGVPRGRGRGRGSRGPRGGTSSRRGRGRPASLPTVPIPEPTPAPPPEPVEKPDAHMCLKYTFGVNAWKQWVTTKNADLERSSRKLKLFNTDLLQMTADELNYSLCLFVNEVRKPTGAEYAPDTIYYLCLGIQQYMYECGRIDNIFCDSFYEKFTDCLDEVCGKFSSMYTDAHYIVTRVEEEHLWESKQLGAHSPFVLLTTLMFFNTKHFNLTSVDEHMQLSFSHIMKHWKRNPGQGSSRQVPVSGRNVLLRFYPPQNAHANTRKKKVYEQQENEDNPLRCPVKLYEFYLSKCPESVKTRNDVFYLLPERSCVPESPVWYSTMPLDVRALRKMLHRVKMVKEINVALLTH